MIMAQANRENSTTRLSALFSDDFVRRAFERAERDNPPVAVEAEPVRPVLNGSDAVRVLELA
jgi:hypothetical protein